MFYLYNPTPNYSLEILFEMNYSTWLQRGSYLRASNHGTRRRNSYIRHIRHGHPLQIRLLHRRMTRQMVLMLLPGLTHPVSLRVRRSA
jgi:hypothetical protein